VFLKRKAVKSLQSQRRWICSQPPVNLWRLGDPPLLLSLTAVVFVECVSSIERTLLQKITEVIHSKCFGFVYSVLSCLFFTANSAVFDGGNAKIYFAPGAWYSPYATNKIIGVGGRGLNIVALCISYKIKNTMFYVAISLEHTIKTSNKQFLSFK